MTSSENSHLDHLLVGTWGCHRPSLGQVVPRPPRFHQRGSTPPTRSSDRGQHPCAARPGSPRPVLSRSPAAGALNAAMKSSGRKKPSSATGSICAPCTRGRGERQEGLASTKLETVVISEGKIHTVVSKRTTRGQSYEDRRKRSVTAGTGPIQSGSLGSAGRFANPPARPGRRPRGRPRHSGSRRVSRCT